MRKLLHQEILQLRLKEDKLSYIQRNPVYLLLYNLRSLYNVGSIFRTSDSALISEILLTGFTPYPPRKEIEKTALGADKTVPWRYFKEPSDAILYLKERKIKVLALEITNSSRPYYSLKRGEFPVCIVLGNELTGIDDKILELCDDSIEIPMFGIKHSLNVSVAAGIAVFEAIKIWFNSINT